MFTTKNLNDMVRGYIGCAEWTNEEDLDGRKPSASFKAEAKKDCEAFLKQNANTVEVYAGCRSYNPSDGSIYAHIGHDFWLSRNGHGTGFWDRGCGAVGDRLHEAARRMGEHYI